MAHDLRIEPRGIIALAAGGTGGHLFPAQALGEVLVKRGYVVHLLSDKRALSYGGKFPAAEIHAIPSATLTLRRPWRLPRQLRLLLQGYRASRTILEDLDPLAIVGFGGYPSYPPLIAASRLNIPVAIHEQNAVMGRANRALMWRADLIGSAFPELADLPERLKHRLVVTGNPVRESVLAAAGRPYRPPGPRSDFRLLVFGGSQGAQFFSELMPAVMAELPNAVRKSLAVTQQCRPEDLDRVRQSYAEFGIKAELQPFFADLPKRIAESHLAICRSGATSIAELTVIGRPAILVPLPHAIDNDQLRNAESFARAGAGWLMRQGEFTPADLAAFLTRIRYEAYDLIQAAGAARALGRPDAAERLADELEHMMCAANGSEPVAVPQPTIERIPS